MEEPQAAPPNAMSVSSDEVLAVLQQRANEDPLIREILRSAAYEAILQRRQREDVPKTGTPAELEAVEEAD